MTSGANRPARQALAGSNPLVAANVRWLQSLYTVRAHSVFALLPAVVVATSLLSICVGAQSSDQTPTAMAAHVLPMIEQTPPERLPPPRKLSGIGNAHIQISATPDAQRWFDQGLNLYHDFWDYESARAFEQAVRADPSCAMCYWGLYKAEGFFHSNSQGYAAPALAKAIELKDRVTHREQLYI